MLSSKERFKSYYIESTESVIARLKHLQRPRQLMRLRFQLANYLWLAFVCSKRPCFTGFLISPLSRSAAGDEKEKGLQIMDELIEAYATRGWPDLSANILSRRLAIDHTLSDYFTHAFVMACSRFEPRRMFYWNELWNYSKSGIYY